MAIRFMRRNLTRRSLPARLRIAAGTPARSLRRQFGQSPIAFHRNLRLEAARHALCDNHTKTDITTAAGMHELSPSSFHRCALRPRHCICHAAHAISDPTSLVVLPASTCAEPNNTALATARHTRWLNRRRTTICQPPMISGRQRRHARRMRFWQAQYRRPARVIRLIRSYNRSDSRTRQRYRNWRDGSGPQHLPVSLPRGA